MAFALRGWLPQVIQAIEPWMSAEDLSAGTRWSPAIAAQLDASSFGIVCLTPENQASEWLHFEAGALAKSVAQGLVAPYLFDLTEGQVKGPLAQFQMKRAEKEPTRELLKGINSQMKSPMPPAQLDRAFDKWWPDLEQELKKIGPATGRAPAKRSLDEMVEETLELVRRFVRVERWAPSSVTHLQDFLGLSGRPDVPNAQQVSAKLFAVSGDLAEAKRRLAAAATDEERAAAKGAVDRLKKQKAGLQAMVNDLLADPLS